MQNPDLIVQQLMEQNKQLIEENCWLKERLELALSAISELQEQNQLLKDEIALLKGQKPRPKIPPSTLEGSQSLKKNKISRGKSPRKKKTRLLKIHDRHRLQPPSIPEGALFKGIQKFTVQDICLHSHNTVYELERWKLADGSYLAAKPPENIQGHYGPKLIAYILHQYYGCRVTAPLLLAQLQEIGVLISKGQINTILIQNKENFHREKDDLLAAGIIATGQIKADDTGSRHQGKNGYSTVIGNEFFTSIETTKSKSRVNFFELLHGTEPQYIVNENAADYIETLKPTHWLKGHLLLYQTDQAMNQAEWQSFIRAMNLKESEIKLATEAALFAGLLEKGIPKDLGVHGDDAGQFDIFVRSLCWVHEERHYRKLAVVNEKMGQAIEEVRKEIWDLYKGLQGYKTAPSESLKLNLEQKFEDLFLKKQTASALLNKRLRKTYTKKEKLLRVLERPQTPLHNNETETDAREMVIKRKISGGTRSDEGRKSRDTFVSLKRTCSKLGVSFMAYLEDRIKGTLELPRLAEIIATRSAAQSVNPKMEFTSTL